MSKKLFVVAMAMVLSFAVSSLVFGAELLTQVPYKINSQGYISQYVSIAKGKKPVVSSNAATVSSKGYVYCFEYKGVFFNALTNKIDYDREYYSRAGYTGKFYFTKLDSKGDYKYAIIGQDEKCESTGLSMSINNFTLTY